MSACATQRALTREQKAEKLLARLRQKCQGLGFGSLDVSLTVHAGQIVQIECKRESEIWRAD